MEITSRQVKCKHCEWTTSSYRGCYFRLVQHIDGKHPQEANKRMTMQDLHDALYEADDLLLQQDQI
mgnify:CR=1 FL=1